MVDLYFNPEYARLYEKIDGPCDTFTYRCEHGTVQNTFILREIKWKIDGETYYDIVTPYGYGGPLILEYKDKEALIEGYNAAFQNYCRQNRIVCEFIRFHLFDNTDIREHYYGTTVKMLDDVIVETAGEYDAIYAQYEHKVRKNIKRALNSGLEMVIENDLGHLDDFLKIYYQTMDRNNAKEYYYFEREYFEDIAKRLPGNFMYFYVMLDGAVISTELVLYSEDYAYSFLGGTNADYYSVRPNDFLKDAIIKWCNQKGIKKFILGGGYQENDGIYRYKRSFTKAEDVPFYVGKAIFNREAYDRFVSEREKSGELDRETGYFPLYRA